MIPAHQWHDNGDGTYWLVADGDFRLEFAWSQLDRPCDTCDGEGVAYLVVHGEAIDDPVDEVDCPACGGTGRHTFDITVEVDWTDRVVEARKHIRHSWPSTLRVSIVPGMVLPIEVQQPPCGSHVYKSMSSDDSSWCLCRNGNIERITLPPAARYGMFVVKLRVAS